ncbi:MAG: hypothetical protein KJ065_24340 [Anaerolineae bacterium]|nr:hypothetical protein [Anaerolineae bacterium]
MKVYLDMELQVNKQSMPYVLVILTALVVVQALVILYILPTKDAHAQEESLAQERQFSDVIEEYIGLAEQDENVRIAFRLRTPLLENAQTYVVPTRRTNEEGTSRVVSEIGSDYVCFDTTGAGTRIMECVPFSNIASIDYLVP